MTGRDMVFFGRMEWGFSTHLWHHLAREFAEDTTVYYIDPLYATTGRHPLDISTDSKDGREVTLIKYGSSFLDRVPVIKRAKIYCRVRRLCHEFKRHNMGNAILFFYNPWDAYDYRSLMKDQTVIYYATDNAKGLFKDPFRTAYVKREDWLCDRADLILGLSRVLTESIAVQYPGKTFYISEGVNPGIFKSKSDAYSELRSRGPRACFVGTLDDSLDWDLLERSARALPHVEFVMVGPVKTEGLEKRFERSGNVKFLGYRRYESLGSILSDVDVCLLMYKDNDFNRMRNPIKLLEYFAAGKIIVSTDFPSAREYPGLVMIAQDRDDFTEKIREAITENMSKRHYHRLLETAVENTWSRRRTEIEALIDGLKKP
jgi:glycosyltransferase involved in cell wall biosynthesis